MHVHGFERAHRFGETDPGAGAVPPGTQIPARTSLARASDQGVLSRRSRRASASADLSRGARFAAQLAAARAHRARRSWKKVRTFWKTVRWERRNAGA